MAGIAHTCLKLAVKPPALEFLHGDEVAPNPRWSMPAHRHSFHELIVVMSGVIRANVAGQSIRGEAGDLLFYQAGRVHEEASDLKAPVNTFFVAFKADDKLPEFPLRLRDTDGRVRQMIIWLVRDYQANASMTGQHGALLQAMVAELRRLCASPVDPWLLELRAHLQDNLAQTIYLDDLARRSGLSKFGFARKFKRMSGRTPMQELRLMRLNQARTMMLTSGLPMKDIAPAVGLGDEYQLSKLFRRQFLISPREMRGTVRRACVFNQA
jgi:AraC-like DNA-binding protein